MPVLRTRFSTAPVAPHERYEAWTARGWPQLPKLFETKPPEGAFTADTEAHAFPDVSVVRSRITGVDYERTPMLARQDQTDHLAIVVILSGGQVWDVPGQPARLGPRSVMLGDFSRPLAWRSLDSHAVALSIPRALAETVVPSVRALHGLSLSPAIAAPLVAQVEALLPMLGGLRQADGAALARAALHMTALCVGQLGRSPDDEAGEILRRAARGRAQALIAARSTDPCFDPDAAAIALGLSRSSLYRLMEPEGGVAAAIRAARVEHLRRSLADPQDTRQVAERSYTAGFSEPSVAIRAFRQAHGLAPLDYRALCLAQMTQGADRRRRAGD